MVAVGFLCKKNRARGRIRGVGGGAHPPGQEAGMWTAGPEN